MKDCKFKNKMLAILSAAIIMFILALKFATN